MKHRVVAVVLSLIVLSTGAPEADAGVSFQVSDQFKKVAKHLSEQYIVKGLKKACGKDQPLCGVVVDHLVQAFHAAVEDDDEGVRNALRGLFTDASITGLLHVSLRDVFKVPGLPKTVSSGVIDRLARCLASHLTDKPTIAACEVDANAKALLIKARLLDTGTADDAAVDRFFAAVGNREQPTFADSITFMAAIVSSSRIDRPDIRAYLFALEYAVEDGLEGGLFSVAQRFMKHELQLLEGISAGEVQLFEPGLFEASFSTKISNCKGDPAAYQAWIANRDVVKRALSKAVSERRRISSADLAPLKKLVGYVCEEKNENANEVMTLRTQSLSLLGEASIHNLRVSRGLQLLAVAAVLDYVRSSDERQFGRDARTIALLALRQAATQIPEANGKPVCELEYARLRLEGVNALPRHCYSLVFGQHISRPEAEVLALVTKLEAKASGLTGDAKQEVLQQANDLTAALQATKNVWDRYRARLSAGSSVEDVLQFVLEHLDETSYVRSLSGDEKKAYDVAKKALRYLVGDRRDAAVKVVARFALELLLPHVEEVAQEFLSADHADCETQNRRASIFDATDAKCVALVLIQAAYGPIADALWDGSIDAERTPNLASKVYKNVLASKLLAGSPIILNVGLGASYVTGDDVIWGADGTAAFTIVDKFGLAFFRSVGESNTFETGPFAGGFLDAIVRSVADADEERRHWLLGYALGWPRLCDSGFGLEFHAAAAMPFALDDYSEFKNGIGFALGAVVVIPWNVFDAGGK